MKDLSEYPTPAVIEFAKAALPYALEQCGDEDNYRAAVRLAFRIADAMDCERLMIARPE